MKKLRIAILSAFGVLVLATAGVLADEDTGRLFSVPAGIFDTTGYLVFVKDTNHLSATQVIYSASLNPASIAKDVCIEEAFTVTGVGASDHITVSSPKTTSGVLDTTYAAVAARPSGANTIAVMFCNPTTVQVDPGEMNYTFMALSSAG